jgi:hypothetical protein
MSAPNNASGWEAGLAPLNQYFDPAYEQDLTILAQIQARSVETIPELVDYAYHAARVLLREQEVCSLPEEGPYQAMPYQKVTLLWVLHPNITDGGLQFNVCDEEGELLTVRVPVYREETRPYAYSPFTSGDAKAMRRAVDGVAWACQLRRLGVSPDLTTLAEDAPAGRLVTLGYQP